jgi:hypothetical protein
MPCFQSESIFLCENDRESAKEVSFPYTDIKENQVFLIYKEIQSGAVAKSYMTNGLLIYCMGKYFWQFAFPHILGSPSSYMTLQLLHSEFPYI